MKRNKVSIICAVAAVVSALTIVACKPPAGPEKKGGSDVSHTGLNFEIPSLQEPGNSIRLSDYKGDVVLLDFWATWCPPCKAELPELNRMYEELKGNGLTIIGMTLDRGSEESVAEAVARLGLKYPVGLATQVAQENPEFSDIRAIPTKFLLDRNGELVGDPIVGVPPGTHEKLKASIEQLLAAGNK